MTSAYQITYTCYVIAQRWDPGMGEQMTNWLAGADGDGNPEWTSLIDRATQSQSYAEQQEAVDLMCPRDEHWVVVKVERSLTLQRGVDGSMKVGDVLGKMGVDQ